MHNLQERLFNVLDNYFVEDFAEMLTLKKSFLNDNKSKVVVTILFSYSKLALSRTIVHEKTNSRNLTDFSTVEILSYINKLASVISTAVNSSVECETFLQWDGLRCPCCGHILRTKPHNTISKGKLRLKTGLSGTVFN